MRSLEKSGGFPSPGNCCRNKHGILYIDLYLIGLYTVFRARTARSIEGYRKLRNIKPMVKTYRLNVPDCLLSEPVYNKRNWFLNCTYIIGLKKLTFQPKLLDLVRRVRPVGLPIQPIRVPMCVWANIFIGFISINDGKPIDLAARHTTIISY